jgi:hypothetical protein
MPTDLRTWAEASAELAVTPHPMSERHLRELFKQRSRRRTWRLPGQRAEYVSLDDVLEFQRDLRNGWLTSNS